MTQRSEAKALRIGELIDDVARGAIRIPNFQRKFKWRASQIADLFDSIYRGYPIGTLFFWRQRAAADVVQLGPLRIDAPAFENALWVVDGQQRLTSLAGVLLQKGSDEGGLDFALHFDLINEKFVRPVANQQVPASWIPVSVILRTSDLLTWQYDNLRDAPQLLARSTELSSRIRDYDVPTYTVAAQDEKIVREIFDRLNNFGKSLTAAEVFRALHAGAGAADPADLSSLSDNVSRSEFGEIPESSVLQSVLAVRGGDVTRDVHGEFAEGEDPSVTYAVVESALLRATTFLRSEAEIPHVRVLPTTLVLPILARFFSLTPEPSEWARRLLRRWVWRMSLGGEFSHSYAATMRRAVLCVEGADEEDARQLLSRLAPSSRPDSLSLDKPRMNSSRTRAQVCLLASRKPRHLITGEPLDVADIFARHDKDGLQRFGGGLRNDDSLASRFIHPPTHALTPEAAAQWEYSALASHLISPEAHRMLIRGDLEGFVKDRRWTVADWFESQQERLAEPEAQDRLSIGGLIALAADK